MNPQEAIEARHSVRKYIDKSIPQDIIDILQIQFVAHIDNQRVARNTVEKSYQGYFENVKSCRFNDFNFI